MRLVSGNQGILKIFLSSLGFRFGQGIQKSVLRRLSNTKLPLLVLPSVRIRLFQGETIVPSCRQVPQ